jgi:hypothetical protein
MISLQNYAGRSNSHSHESANIRNIGQGEAEHRKYKRHKLGSGQAYDP